MVSWKGKKGKEIPCTYIINLMLRMATFHMHNFMFAGENPSFVSFKVEFKTYNGINLLVFKTQAN